ncbi:hypothetical protein EFS29_16680, partial [Lactiplantibacillus plantarum]|nr:hypothetical protein [Lactiplantibacillus plantarum]
QLLKDGFVVNTILKEADLFCPNSVRINFTIYQRTTNYSIHYEIIYLIVVDSFLCTFHLVMFLNNR